MKKIIITFGIISGIIGLVSNYLSLNQIVGTWTLLGVSLIIFLLIYFLGIKNFKDANNGFATFREVFLLCLGISVLGTVISVIGNQIYVQTLSEEQKADIATKFIDTQLAAYESIGIEAPENVEEDLEEAAEAIFDPKSILLGTIGSLVGSAFFAVILALIFKKEPPSAVA